MLTVNEILFLHAAGIEAFGGTSGLRDRRIVEAAIAEPFQTFGGQDLYPTIWDKVAAMGRALVCNHAFVDGNKRVGFTAMAVVLSRNGYELECTADEGERVILSLITAGLNREGLAQWLQANSVDLGRP